MLFTALALALTATPVDIAAPLAVVVVAQADPAGDITPTLEDAPGLIAQMIQAVREKNWELFAAMLALLIVLAFNTLILRFNVLADAVRKEALPWLAAGTGMLVSFAWILLEGGGWWAAISSGLIIGTAAIGMWEMIGKRIKKWLAARRARSA